MLWRRIRQGKGTRKTGGVCAAALKSTVEKISLTLGKDVKEPGELGVCGETVLRAKETAGTKAWRWECGWHIQRTTTRSA